MMEAESLATALNKIITRFDPLPMTVYSHNAWNLSKTTGLRFRWVLEETKFLCGRFHYANHTCSGCFDPDSYKAADPSKTSAAEAINRTWKISRNHVRYLAGRNFVPFLFCRSLMINLRAVLKETGSQVDVEDKNVYELGNKLLPCNCYHCHPPEY